jgi:hypothetical protein
MMNDDLCILDIVQISCDEAKQKSWSLPTVWMRVVIVSFWEQGPTQQ